MELFVLTALAVGLILSGIAFAIIVREMFERAIDRKTELVCKHIDVLHYRINKLEALDLKRGKNEQCSKEVPKWDEVTDPNFSWDKQASGQCSVHSRPEGTKRYPAQEG